jgi:hypothetical protein
VTNWLDNKKRVVQGMFTCAEEGAFHLGTDQYIQLNVPSDGHAGWQGCAVGVLAVTACHWFTDVRLVHDWVFGDGNVIAHEVIAAMLGLPYWVLYQIEHRYEEMGHAGASVDEAAGAVIAWLDAIPAVHALPEQHPQGMYALSNEQFCNYLLLSYQR